MEPLRGLAGPLGYLSLDLEPLRGLAGPHARLGISLSGPSTGGTPHARDPTRALFLDGASHKTGEGWRDLSAGPHARQDSTRALGYLLEDWRTPHCNARLVLVAPRLAGPMGPVRGPAQLRKACLGGLKDAPRACAVRGAC